MTDRIAGKAALDSAEAKMREDKRLEVSGEIPFNPKRLILGCFKPLYTMGRERCPPSTRTCPDPATTAVGQTEKNSVRAYVFRFTP